MLINSLMYEGNIQISEYEGTSHINLSLHNVEPLY